VNALAGTRVPLNDGSSIPQMGLGVFQVDPRETTETVAAALRVGYRHIDTARLYENEAEVGQGIRESGVDPAEIYVATKVWNDEHGADATRRAFERSLDLLGLDTIDLYLIHWPAPTQNLYVETWRTLVDLRAEGRVRSIGVSNFQPHHLERIIGETGEVPAVNQVELHPLFPQEHLRLVNRLHGIVTESWSPLARGRLLTHAGLADIARQAGRTPAQVVLRWHLQHGLVVIPRSTSPVRLRENAEALSWELSDDLMNRVDRLAVDGRIGRHPDDRD